MEPRRQLKKKYGWSKSPKIPEKINARPKKPEIKEYDLLGPKIEVDERKFFDGPKFSVVIPTMWKSDKISVMLPIYEDSPLVEEVILIDNEPKSKNIDISNFKKVKYFSRGSNIFVNPAWNWGWALSKHKLILANDDIIIRNLSEVLDLINSSNLDIIGGSLDPKSENPRIEEIDKFPYHSYGCFMYIKDYKYIPEQLKIWEGDKIQFEKAKTRGILKGVGIETAVSETIKSNLQEYRINIGYGDVRRYESFHQSTENDLNIFCRTSGRPNFFKFCVESIKKFAPSAILHVTVDNEESLEYVKDYTTGMRCNYYLINKNTIEEACKKVKLNRDRPFIYNFYFNVISNYVDSGWIKILDDDDELISPIEYGGSGDTIYINKANLQYKVVPSESSFMIEPRLNDMSSLCYVVNKKLWVDWIPNRGGDFDFISSIFKKNVNAIWSKKIHSQCQLGEGLGKRLDRGLSKLNTIFDKIYVVNLDRSKERINKLDSKLKSLGIEYTRFSAIDGDSLDLSKFDLSNYNSGNSPEKYKYELGCTLSHIGIIEDAKKNKYGKILILEDDVLISKSIDDIQDKLKALEDWKILYLGGSQHIWEGVEEFNENFYLSKNTLGTFAYALDKSIYDEVILSLRLFMTTADDTMAKVQEKNYGKCFTLYPNYIVADVSESLIRKSRNQEEHSIKMKWNLRNDYI
jgi:GR25 family glycosyltransferase involved in LPS biosynthesis